MTVFEPTLASEKLAEATGKTWEEWLVALDQAGAAQRTHTEIARWLTDEQGIPGWWAQSITVGYERARGLRDPGPRKDGWSASSSKTIEVPIEKLFNAFSRDSIREKWLPETELHLRSASAPESASYDWGEGPTFLVLRFESISPTRSRVVLEHEKLPDAEVTERLKTWWRSRFITLKKVLEAG